MNKFILSFLLFCSFVYSGCSTHQINTEKVYQYSTIQALLDSKLTGTLTYGELKKRGNHGIGTFNFVDGEMIMVDGVAYRAYYDGSLYIVTDETLTPFAIVDHFVADKNIDINEELTCSQLKDTILDELTDKDQIYSIKVIGNFSVVNARSVKKSDKEGEGLKYVVENQNKFDFKDIDGTAAGFWFPEAFTKVNVPGFHFHFVSKDRKNGGHMLNCKVKSAKVLIDSNSEIEIDLPN